MELPVKITLRKTHSVLPCGSQSTHMEALEEVGNDVARVYEYSSREKDVGNMYGRQLGSPKRWGL